MRRFASTNYNHDCKDASVYAPSVKCAHNSDHSSCTAASDAVSANRFANISVITGIAAAVSVFLFSIISIIAYGIIICGMYITFISIIMSIIFIIYTIITNLYICNKSAKLC